MRKYGFVILALGLFVPLSAAQAPKSSYEGEESREIKSLSQDEIEMYLRGAGMGLAKPAELNRYPGPKHVLELAKELELLEDQRRETEKLVIDTKARAKQLGEEIVALERELDRLFAGGMISESELSRIVSEVGSKQAELRLVHLRAHLRQRSILSSEQTARYVSLRGYEVGERHRDHHGGKH